MTTYKLGFDEEATCSTKVQQLYLTSMPSHRLATARGPALVTSTNRTACSSHRGAGVLVTSAQLRNAYAVPVAVSRQRRLVEPQAQSTLPRQG
jgi:hypothetical protein